jgi:hypothetical protein
MVVHKVPSDNVRMIKEIIDVPFPLAASRRLISFLTFHISMFFSASVPFGALMVKLRGRSRALPSKGAGPNSYTRFRCKWVEVDCGWVEEEKQVRKAESPLLLRWSVRMCAQAEADGHKFAPRKVSRCTPRRDARPLNPVPPAITPRALTYYSSDSPQKRPPQ